MKLNSITILNMFALMTALLMSGCGKTKTETVVIYKTNIVEVYHTNETSSTQRSKSNNLQLVEAKITSNPNAAELVIQGLIENRSAVTFKHVDAKFNLLDSRGIQVGTTSATTYQLAPGQTWKFQTYGFGYNKGVKSFQPPLIVGTE